MNILNKIRWRVEKYVLDPLVRCYLKSRIFQTNDSFRPTMFLTEPSLTALNYKYIFQSMATSQDMTFLQEADFSAALERGLQNDPIYHHCYFAPRRFSSFNSSNGLSGCYEVYFRC